MAIGDIYQLIDWQEFAGQHCLNIYYYQLSTASGAAPYAEDLATLFAAGPLVDIVEVQVSGLQHTQIVVTCPDDFSDFFTLPLVAPIGTGTAGTEGLPPYAAGSIRLNRATRELRNGQKRFAGPPESAQTNGTVTTAYTTAMNTIAADLAANLTGGSAGAVWVPRIVRKQRVPPYAITAHIGIAGAQFVALTTQNTRKIGRGI